jgi:aryl-alcohol dehydrogenase-like predicted oxidoreductase
MELHPFGSLFPVSTLTLGGGGLGMLWGQTTFEECVATVHAAIAAGINLLDLAPRYGDGKAERVVGEAFGGRLPGGVHVTSKCNLGNPPPDRVYGVLRQSIETSLRLLQMDRLDIFFLHSTRVPDGHAMWNAPDVSRLTPLPLFRLHVRPAFEKLKAEGLIGAWGLTGIGHPDAIIEVLAEDPKPAAVQCIANLLDSPGGLKFFDGPAKPREVMAAARVNHVGVMGIRAVQAGALTDAIDRELPADHPEMQDYARAAGFRALCAEIGEDPAIVAHRYALGMPIDMLVLGVKNRTELADCIAAAEAGPLPNDLVARIDASVARDGAGRAIP